MCCVSIVFNFQFSFNSTRAQDIHFSMLDLDPMLFNPAYSGFFDGTGRFGAVYRNQWATVSKPFQTLSATAEFSLMRSNRTMNGLSAGVCISTDHEGTLSYGSTSAVLVMSYFQSLDRNGNNILSAAVEAGGGQIGFSTEGIEMDDPSEQFGRTRASYPTLGAGVAWFWQVNDVLYTKAGVAMRNINEPDISYLGVSDVRLARRLTAYARAEWRAAPQWGVLPVLGFQQQGNFRELVYGCDARWYLRESQRDYLAFSAGLLGRLGDAMAVNMAVLWRDWIFAFSYDANLSKLAAASHTIGAFELGVVYMIRKKDHRTSALPCPIL
ncbi:MAG: PorP/SprF family type IX secretion system membrane protein [Bacteroidales bacterium]|nr:PorP/SprF family type IX secretion system membrane protein [Bacteroidales bacterium]